MASRNEIAARIISGVSRKALRAQAKTEGFKFSSAFFQQVRRGGQLGARNVSDAAITALKSGLKSNRTPSASMLLPDPNIGTKYLYRANIVTDDPQRGIVKIVGRFGDDRLLTGRQIREKMEAIGEQSVDSANTQGPGYQFGGRVRRIEILSTLVKP